MGRTVEPQRNSIANLGDVVLSALTATPALLSTVAAVPTGRESADILEARVLGQLTDGTDRVAILYGNSSSCLGYCAAGTELRLPVKAGNIYLRTVAGNANANILLLMD